MANPYVNLGIKQDAGTVTAASGAATLNKVAGRVTSEALTTAAAATYTLTLTNSKIGANSLVLVSVGAGTTTQGVPVVTTTTVSAGKVVVIVQNNDAADALDGAITIDFVVLNAN